MSPIFPNTLLISLFAPFYCLVQFTINSFTKSLNISPAPRIILIFEDGVTYDDSGTVGTSPVDYIRKKRQFFM